MSLNIEAMVLRLILSVAVGWILGKGRKIRNKPVGTRTHILICMTAAIISMISAYGYADFESSRTMDPARLTTGILTGIGFIGAGIIWKDNSGDIRGITTAANIFLTACLGIAIGVGHYILTAAAVILAVATLEATTFFSNREKKKLQQKENIPEGSNSMWSYDVQDQSDIPIIFMDPLNREVPKGVSENSNEPKVQAEPCETDREEGYE